MLAIDAMRSSKDETEGEEGEQPLDLEPLLSLAPMFPTPPGYDLVSAPPQNPPLMYITPRSSADRRRASASPARPSPASSVPLEVMPISAAIPTPRHEARESSDGPFVEKREPGAAKRARRGGGSSNAAGVKRRPARRSLQTELAGWPSSLGSPRESVGAAMVAFDSLRRRMLQLGVEEGGASKRADLKAGAFMKHSNLRINTLKTVGAVPGVEVGDIFFFRIEMCVVGLHAPSMAGIDYMPARRVGEDDAVAVSIISSGGYENDEDDADTLVYTGHGGNSRHKEKHDQKLERGNLALATSSSKKNQIRVVRAVQDPLCKSGKIYVYDGLYRIQDSWMDTASNGFNVFKHRLRRDPGQPHGISVWKMAEKWRSDPASREMAMSLDLSSGAENLPVCLVDDVDGGERRPSHFDYVAGVRYLRPFDRSEPLQSCKCSGVCLPGDSNCSCTRRNGGDLPYSSAGVLARRVPMIYECSSSCHCSENCPNRVTQRGVRLRFEVFWTRSRGWGLRSWDPIRAGTFVCEYAGEVINETKTDAEDEEDEDDHTFRTTFPTDKVLRWNVGVELLREKSSTEIFKQHPIVISAQGAGNVARFINHSCSPNLLWQAVQYDHGDDGYPHIMFFAMEHVPPMTELTYDYGVRGHPPGFKGKFNRACNLRPCLCRSANCRAFF